MLRYVERDPLKFSCWRIANGQLYKYVKLKYPDLGTPSDEWKLVMPKEKRQELIA